MTRVWKCKPAGSRDLIAYSPLLIQVKSLTHSSLLLKSLNFPDKRLRSAIRLAL